MSVWTRRQKVSIEAFLFRGGMKVDLPLNLVGGVFWTLSVPASQALGELSALSVSKQAVVGVLLKNSFRRSVLKNF